MGMAVGNGSPQGDEDDGGYRPLAEINITPMVDVMLVLLIIFMVAAPLMVAGVPLELPNTSAARVSQSKKAMVVSLAGDGGLYIREEQVSADTLVPRLRELLSNAGLAALEADIRFPYRYLIDHGIRAGIRIEGESTPAAGGLRVFRNPELAPAETGAALRVLSLDIETPLDASAIWSVALVGDGADEVHLLAREPVRGALAYPDERRLLGAVVQRMMPSPLDVAAALGDDEAARLLRPELEKYGYASQLAFLRRQIAARILGFTLP